MIEIQDLGSMSSTVTAAQHYFGVGELMEEGYFAKERRSIVLVAVVNFVYLGMSKIDRYIVGFAFAVDFVHAGKESAYLHQASD